MNLNDMNFETKNLQIIKIFSNIDFNESNDDNNGYFPKSKVNCTMVINFLTILEFLLKRSYKILCFNSILHEVVLKKIRR